MTTYLLDDTSFGLRFQVFRFVGNQSYIYVHCKVLVCGIDEKQEFCDQTCHVTPIPDIVDGDGSDAVIPGEDVRKKRNAKVRSMQCYIMFMES